MHYNMGLRKCREWEKALFWELQKLLSWAHAERDRAQLASRRRQKRAMEQRRAITGLGQASPTSLLATIYPYILANVSICIIAHAELGMSCANCITCSGSPHDILLVTEQTWLYTCDFLAFADAAYRFFRSRVEERSVSKRGLTSDKQKQKRRHERLTRVSIIDARSRFVHCLCSHGVLLLGMCSLWCACIRDM